MSKAIINIHKKTFNISKGNLDRLIKEFSLKTVISTNEYKDCSSCPFCKNTNNITINNYCENYCPNIMIQKEYETLNLKANSNGQYKLPNLAIKLMLLYYSITDSHGLLKEVRKKHLANILNCSIKSIDNNNIILEELGFITLANKCYGKISLFINNYEKQHTKGGEGYLVVGNVVMLALLNSPSIHITTLLIKALKKYDIDTLLHNETNISYEQLKKLIPSVAYPKGLDRLLENIEMYLSETLPKIIEKFIGVIPEKIFNIIKNIDNSISFALFPAYNGKTIIKNEESSFNDYCKETAQNNKKQYKFLNANRNNFIELCKEYGFKEVWDIIHLCFLNAFDTIKNPGAYIREKIRYNISIKNSALNI